jgi:hypothetical protein
MELKEKYLALELEKFRERAKEKKGLEK